MLLNYQLCVFNSLIGFFGCWEVASMYHSISKFYGTDADTFII